MWRTNFVCDSLREHVVGWSAATRLRTQLTAIVSAEFNSVEAVHYTTPNNLHENFATQTAYHGVERKQMVNPFSTWRLHVE